MRPSWLLAISLLLGMSVAQSGPSVEPRIVEHGRRDSNKIALTFDACPTGRDDEYDAKVIEVLVASKVPATLFLSGRWVEKNRETTKVLAADPRFEIANHAYWHPHLLEKDDERILRELKRTQEIIRKVTGKRPRYFRPPFGEVDERLVKLAAVAGLVTVQYDIASGDPDPGLSAKRIVRGVVEEARGGSIVVFHMNENGLRTAEVLPGVIKGLRERGFELVTVGEMLQTADTGTSTTETLGDRRGRGDTGKQTKKEAREDQRERSAATPSLMSSVIVTVSVPTAETVKAPGIISEQTPTMRAPEHDHP